MGSNTVTTDVTATSATYAAPATGTAASVTVSVTSGQKILVTLSTACENTNALKGCFMSFDGSGGFSYTATGGAADNTNAVGTDAGVAAVSGSYSSSWVLTATSTASTTFTAKFRRIVNTATFHYNTIIGQVFGETESLSSARRTSRGD